MATHSTHSFIGITKCFRCYVEMNENNHRIVIEDNEMINEKVVKFDTILSELRQITNNENIGFDSHLFQVLKPMNRRFVEITDKEFGIENTSKIRVSLKWGWDSLKQELNTIGDQNPLVKCWSKWPNLTQSLGTETELYYRLIKAIKSQLSSKYPNTTINWKLVSVVVQSYGYQHFDSNWCRKRFSLLIAKYSLSLTQRVFNRNNNISDEIDGQTGKVFSELGSMYLRPYMSRQNYRSLQRLKNTVDIRETVDWLLNQTSLSLESKADLTELKPEVRVNTTENSRLETKDKSDVVCVESELKLDSNEKTLRNRRVYELNFESTLVALIHTVMTTSEFNWTSITQSMQTLGFKSFNELFYDKYFDLLISQYISLLKICDNELNANNLWSLFLPMNALDLQSFCSANDYKQIQELKVKFLSKEQTSV